MLYFFFRNGDPKTCKSSEMVASIIDQLVISHVDLRTATRLVDVFKGLYDKERSGTCRTFKKLWDTFLDMLNQLPKHVFIVLDALDECDDRIDLMRSLAALNSGARFLVTSRPEQDIIEKLEEESKSKFSSLEMDVDGDIQNVVTEAVKHNKRLAKFQDEIISTIKQKAEGMFRYAALVLMELHRPTVRKVSATLRSMPKGLFGMYELILLHLHPEDLDIRRKILLWIAMAYRPVTVDEMAYACAVEDTDDDFDPTDYPLLTADDIRRVCGSLVEIFDDDQLRFTHLSVKEFLLQSPQNLQDTDKRISDCLVDKEQAHISMAITCSK